MRALALALVCSFAFAGVGFSATPDADGSWSSAPEMLKARAAHAVVSTGKTIYALAGTGPDGPVLDVERFDGRKWKLETRLPGNGLNAPAAVVIEDKIYLVGGFNTTTNVPSSDVLVYDLRKKAWSNAAELPAPRGGHAAVVLDGKIHVVGGGNSNSTIAEHSVYDPATNQWRDLAPLPRSEGSPALVAFHDKLYAIGGRSGSSDFGDVYIYDAATDSWTYGPAISPRGTAGAVEHCGTLYLFGGESQLTRSSLSEAFRLDEAQGKWVDVKPMLHARNFARAVLFKDSIYVVGGSLTAGSSHASAGSKIVESFNAPCAVHN